MEVSQIMTPGPTQVRENVRMARSIATTNPDLDLQFYEFYKETCEKVGLFLKTNNQVRILSGEGILGLEAACASLTEAHDRVLVIDNGIFGEGFADFVKMYGGEVVFFKGRRKCKIDVAELEKFLEKDHDFKYATVVHCDTPSGVLNDISKICNLLKQKGILTVVDSVAAMGGEDIRVDEWKIDIALGASQKCVSAPSGLTFLSISEEAFKLMQQRKKPIASYYCNLLVWKDYYENKWFPYTPPISDIIGLRQAIDNILDDKEIIQRHESIGKATRRAVIGAGLNLYIEEGYSNTVTVIQIPKGVSDKELLKHMIDKFNVFISGSFGYLQGKVIRIGHMGENARKDKMAYTLLALQDSLKAQGFECEKNMVEAFLKEV